MAKVVVAKLSSPKKVLAGAKGTTITEKSVRDEAGKLHTVYKLDGRSKTFSNDLTYVFTRTVAEARRENKRVTGVTDRAPAKA